MVKANSTLKLTWQLSLGLLLMFVVPFLGTAQTFTGGGNPQPIPATGTGGFPCVGGPTTSDATVALMGGDVIGTDVGIDDITIDLTHTFDSDLEITLVSPMGTTLDLTSDNGSSGDNYTNTVFTDGAPNITTGTAPFTGMFEPEGGTLNGTFDGENANGTWTLEICDDAGGDSGELLLFEITFGDPVMTGGPVTTCGDGNPQPIPMTGTGGFPCTGGPTTSTATVAENGIIGVNATLVSVEIDLTHTFDSDLEIDLISPAGTVWDLTSDNGGAGDNFTNTVFADGNPSITTGTAPFTGTFEAEEGPFATAFDGETTAGDWVLSICDDAGGDTGTLLSYCITFDVQAPPAVPNDLCALAEPIACDQTISGTTIEATIDDDVAGFCGTSVTSPGVWYTFVGDGGTYTASVCDAADFDTKLSVYSGTCDALVCVDGNDDDFVNCSNFTSQVENFSTVDGETYYILVHAFGGETGNFDLTLTCCAPPVAVCQDLEFIANNADPIVITPDDIDDGSTADCGGLVLSLDRTEFDCLDDGENAVTLTATDMFGNTDQCEATVTIVNTFVATEVGCIADVNVTLGEECSARITPFMVLTGNNLECAANIEITVDGGDSDVINGCGEHTYVAEIFEPAEAITEFRAQDWDLVENTGAACAGEFATATLAANQLDLSIRWGLEVSATFTAPYDGEVAFNYDFNGADATWDFLVIDVNGTVIVNETFADAGAVVETLLEGQTAIVRIEDDDFCGIPATASTDVTLTNFSFMSEEELLVYTCWGNIFAEDKTDPIVDCPDNISSVTVDYNSYTLSGDLDVTDPTLELANYSCFNDFNNPLDGDHPYEVQTFTVTQSDVYTFVVNSSFAGGVFNDANVAIYQGGFDAENPCENVIAHNEDAFGNIPGNTFDPRVRISLPLIAGETYTLFVSNWDDASLGAYEVNIFADGDGGVTGVNPEPVEFTFDLLCGDVDYVAFDFPQSWIVDADGTLDRVATRNTFFGGSNAALEEFLDKLAVAGIPDVSDNCGQVVVTLSDDVDEAGDCGDITLTRTFTVADRYNSTCIGEPRTASCDQIITFRRASVADVEIPPVNAVIECDEEFPTDGSVGGPDDNPHASATGYPFVVTAFGIFDLDQTYCNLGANYSDEPRIEVCEGSYKFRREWNLINWCDPSENGTLDQFVKVGDYTGPEITGIPEVINVSTSPFDCLAYITIPNPGVNDGNGCSSAFATTYTVLAFGESFFAGGNIADGDVVAAPIGEHRLVLCAEDDCGNETCEAYTIVVADDIEPTAVCDDELNVSIGGGDIANGIEGIARVFATDFDEGSNDNCGEVTLEVRRNYWRNDTCDPSENRWSPWGEYVDFYCCDIDNEITIELRVTDEAGNSNVCWQVVTPEDKLNPFCYAPADVELTCVDLPLAFPGDLEAAYDDDFEGTSIMMSAIFGNATGTDNCAVDTIVERTPNIQINECGWGTITRRFEVWQLRPEGDVNMNGAIDINEVFRSTNSCSQEIEITEVHDFVIDFPEDADADCGDPDVPTIITEADGCDVLSVNIGDPVIFEATGDECYKYSITYDVINWCLWDGEYEGYVIARMTEDDGEALPVDRAVEGNERPVVRYNDDNGLCIDRRHNDRDGDSGLDNCEDPVLPNYGRYIYTQFVKVYDSTAPVVTVGEYGGPTDNCPDLLPGQFGDDDGNCEEAVSIPFSVADDCELFDGDGNLVISIVSAELDAFAVDANGDGDIKSNEFVADLDVADLITDNGDGTYSFDGTFPIITDAMGDNVIHALRILFEDGCGNQVSEYIVFDVIDCKGPAPICINGLTVTLMPQEDGGCAMAIWASDFEGSPIFDCTGQGPATNPAGQLQVHSYAIYRAADVEADPNFVPSPDDTGLVLTQDDEETTVVYVYAFDEDGNYDYCETYILVQQHVDCGAGTGTLSGVIMTEESETVEGVQVNVNGGEASMTTNADGTFSFELPEGGDYSVTPYLNAEPLNGVSTFDLVLMSKHILGVQALDSPYKRIAADINRSESITTLDMIQLRKLILNIDTEFQNNTSWRFVDASYNFPQPLNPWFELFPELRNQNNLVGEVLDVDFVGVKIGDVNGSAQANALAGDDRTLNGEFNFQLGAESLVKGNIYTVAFRGADMESVAGFQGTLRLQGAELLDIEYGVAQAENFGLRYVEQGMITTSWNGEATSEDVLFSLVIRANDDVELSEVISINSRYTEAEAYGNGNTMNVGVVFDNGDVADAGFELYQNTPNPFQSETMISFNLPEDAEVTLTINDAAGRALMVVRGDYAAGYNTINLAKSQIQGANGVLSYTISTDEFSATKTMIAVK